MGQEVTWRGRHFGIWQTLTSRITMYDRPSHFRDSMAKGAFRSFDHDHIFRRGGGATVMEDVFEFKSPMWFLGRVADFVVLNRHMQNILVERARAIKIAAESDAWRDYLDYSSEHGE